MKIPPWVPVAAGVLAVATLLLWRSCDRDTSEDIGKWQEIAKRLQRDSALAANTIRRVDSVFTRDTLIYTRSRNVYRERVDSIQVVRRETLTVTERVIVAAADTAIRACQAVVTSRTARVAARDSLIRVLGEQRTADQRLHRAQLARANPRITPYVEALADPIDSRTVYARAGLEIRLLGAVRLVGAAQHATTGPHATRALIGVRVTF